MAFLNVKTSTNRPSKWRWLFGKLMPAPVSYRPERHYMRGPGPKYREKHPVAAAPQSSR
jgi:hypothetical protein